MGCFLFVCCLVDDMDDLVDLELLDVTDKKPRVVKPRTDPFNDYDDVEFKTRFRLGKPVVQKLLEQVSEHHWGSNILGGGSYLVICRPLIALILLVTTGTYRDVAWIFSFMFTQEYICTYLHTSGCFINININACDKNAWKRQGKVGI